MEDDTTLPSRGLGLMPIGKSKLAAFDAAGDISSTPIWPRKEVASWEFLSLPNCAVEVLVHARRHGLVVLISNVFAYHLRVQEAVTANAAMPLVAGEDVRTPIGAFRVVFGIGHFDNQPSASASTQS
jgi:hypothetical protein